MENALFRAEDVGCSGGSYAVGLREEPERTKSGRIYEHCGLYSSHAVARNVNESMTHIPDRSYGIAMAPLEMMADADVVIILCTAKQAYMDVQNSFQPLETKRCVLICVPNHL